MKRVLICTLLSLNFLIASVTKNQILQDIKEKNIVSVDFVFTDMLGDLKVVKIPENMVDAALVSGLKFDGSSIPGCSDITSSDMHLAPDLSTWRLIPKHLSKYPSGLIICDVCFSETEPYWGDPRQMLKRALNSNSLKLIVGVELEFYLLDRNNKPFDSNNYFAYSHSSDINNLINLFFTTFKELGINVVKQHHEVSTGQLEFVVGHGEALSVADQVVLAKYVIKSLAEKSGLKANFMAKPIFGINGSGMHMHFSLFDSKSHKNAFYDENGEFLLSDTAKSFMAGVLKYIKELSSLFNSSVNSYKRLVPGYEAPIFICWGAKNRSSLIRIPLVNKDEPNSVRAEIRCPDPLCNPYIALTALSIAGFSGIEENLKLQSSVSSNLYKLTLSEVENLNIDSLPTSLKESLNYFRNSSLVKNKFNSQFIEQFINLKSKEIKSFETSVTDWEMKNYS